MEVVGVFIVVHFGENVFHVYDGVDTVVQVVLLDVAGDEAEKVCASAATISDDTEKCWDLCHPSRRVQGRGKTDGDEERVALRENGTTHDTPAL